MRKVLWWMGLADLKVTNLIIYPTALFWGAQIGRNERLSEPLIKKIMATAPLANITRIDSGCQTKDDRQSHLTSNVY